MNIMKVCRGCLATETRFCSLSNESLKKSFEAFCKVKISKKTILLLCYECYVKVMKLLEFQRMCCKVNKIFEGISKTKKNNHQITNEQKLLLQSKRLELNCKPLNFSNTLAIDVCCSQRVVHTQNDCLAKEQNGIISGTSNDVKPLNEEFNLYFDIDSMKKHDATVDVKIEKNSTDFDDSSVKSIEMDADALSYQNDFEDFKVEITNEVKYSENKIIKPSLQIERKNKKMKKKTINEMARIKSKEGNTKLVEICSNLVCRICQKQFKRVCDLKKHKAVHSERLHACTVCNKSYKWKYHLNSHMSTHTGHRQYVCEECGKIFSTSTLLRNHLLIHRGVKKFECGYCGKKFLRKVGLEIHIRIHTGEKSFVCDFCGKAFTAARNLVAHRRIHLGIKPYSCSICNKRFTESGTVKPHMRLHTGEKPYSCTMCNKTFRTSSGLHTHEMVHSDLKPHQCDICSSSFRKKSHLKRHKLIHDKHLKNG